MHGYHKQLKVKLGVLYIHLLIWMCKHARLLQGLLHYTHKDVNVSKLGTLAITWGNRLCLLLFPMLHSNLYTVYSPHTHSYVGKILHYIKSWII